MTSMKDQLKNMGEIPEEKDFKNRKLVVELFLMTIFIGGLWATCHFLGFWVAEAVGILLVLIAS